MSGTVQKQLDSTMPAIFNLDAQGYKLLVSDGSAGGALAAPLADLAEFRDYYTKTINVDDASDVLLDKIIALFSGLTRFYGEPDDYFRLRYKSLVERRAYDNWTVPEALRKSYSYFFDEKHIYIVESHPTTNLVANGSFDSLEGWTASGNAEAKLIYSKSFENASALQIIPTTAQDKGTIRQTIACQAGWFSLVFFFSSTKKGPGAIEVTIQNTSNGKYWNPSTKLWQTSKKALQYYVDDPSPGEYTFEQLFMPVDTGTITLSFSTVSSAGFLLDAVAFGPVEYPNIRALLVTDPEVFYDGRVKHDNTLSHNGFLHYYILESLDDIMQNTRAAGVRGETFLLSNRLNIPWDKVVLPLADTVDATNPLRHDGKWKFNSATTYGIPDPRDAYITTTSILQALYDNSKLHNAGIFHDGKYAVTQVYYEGHYGSLRHYVMKFREMASQDLFHDGKIQYNGAFTYSGRNYGVAIGIDLVKINHYVNVLSQSQAKYNGLQTHNEAILHDGVYSVTTRQLASYYI